MNKDSYISFEKYLTDQENWRSDGLRTGSSYKQNHYIRQHLADVLLHRLGWHYWITFTFGYEPILEEIEEVLSKLHYRIDRRLVKQLGDKQFLTKDERSEWILFPELDGHHRHLHYHGFIKLNVRPILPSSYENEWWWLKSALDNNIPSVEHILTNDGGRIHYKHYERKYRKVDDLKQILYSLKQYGSGASHYDQNPTFDRIAHTILSHEHWAIQPITKHRSTNKTDRIPPLVKNQKEGLFRFTN